MEQTKKKSGFATAGLVLGIIGLCTSFIPIVNNLSFILVLIGGIFAVISLIKKASKGMAIASLIICIIAGVIVIQSQQALSNSIDTFSSELDKATGNSTEEILKNDVDVTLGKFEVKKEGYFTETKLVVKVKNKTSETKSFNIHIEAIDKNGSRVAEDYVYANELRAEQTQSFDTFNLVSSDKIKELQGATFKIVEVSMY